MSQAVFIPQDIFSIKGRGIVVTGFLKSGTLSKGMEATINHKKSKVVGIEAFRKSLQTVSSLNPEAKSLGVLLKNVVETDIHPYIEQKTPIYFG